MTYSSIDLPIYRRMYRNRATSCCHHLRKRLVLHPLESEWDINAETILSAIRRSSDLTLRGIRGIIAEATFEILLFHNWPPLGGSAHRRRPVLRFPFARRIRPLYRANSSQTATEGEAGAEIVSLGCFESGRSILQMFSTLSRFNEPERQAFPQQFRGRESSKRGRWKRPAPTVTASSIFSPSVCIHPPEIGNVSCIPLLIGSCPGPSPFRI